MWCPEDYPLGSEGIVNLIGYSKQISDAEATYISWCTPRGLPALHDWGDSSDSSSWFLACRVMIYSPHGVARQFRFDQGVPNAIAIDTNFMHVVRHLVLRSTMICTLRLDKCSFHP